MKSSDKIFILVVVVIVIIVSCYIMGLNKTYVIEKDHIQKTELSNFQRIKINSETEYDTRKKALTDKIQSYMKNIKG